MVARRSQGVSNIHFSGPRCLLKSLRFLFELAKTSPNFIYGLKVLRATAVSDL